MSAMLPSHARTMEIVAIRLGLTFVIASQGGKAKTVKQVEEIFHFTRVKNVASFKFSINVPLIMFYITNADIDECTEEPCENNGTCHNNNGSYQCECMNGFQGHHCGEGM